MVAMAMLCGTRIRYASLLVHLVGGDLASGVEERGDSSGRRFRGVVDLVRFMYVTSFMLEASNRFKGSKATTSALGRWSLGHMHKDFPTVANFG
jgi:hypothetical protein